MAQPGASQPPPCQGCGQPMAGKFVKAFGGFWHLACFACGDCGVVVTDRYYDVGGRPFCELHYFRRKNLLCGACGQPILTTSLTAAGKRWHPEHFGCHICKEPLTVDGAPCVFFEFGGDPFCKFHYAIRHAARCAGCAMPILDQYVADGETARWHVGCYKLHKIYDVRLRMPSEQLDAVLSPDPAVPLAQARTTFDELAEEVSARVTLTLDVLWMYEEAIASFISESVVAFEARRYPACRERLLAALNALDVLLTAVTEVTRGGAIIQLSPRDPLWVAMEQLFSLMVVKDKTSPRSEELLMAAADLARAFSALTHVALVEISQHSPTVSYDALDRFVNTLKDPYPYTQPREGSDLPLMALFRARFDADPDFAKDGAGAGNTVLFAEDRPDELTVAQNGNSAWRLSESSLDEAATDELSEIVASVGEAPTDQPEEQAIASVTVDAGVETEFAAAEAQYLSELSALQLLLVKQFAVKRLAQLVRDHYNQSELMQLIVARRKPLFARIFGSLKSSVRKKRPEVSCFGCSLEEALERSGVESRLGFGPGILRIPALVDAIIRQIDRRGLTTPGIFRRAGSQKRIGELKDIADRVAELSANDFADVSVIDLAAFLKRFLREMPEPLLTNKLYDLLLLSQKFSDESMRREVLHLTVLLLPRSNRELLEALCAFFRRVAAHSGGTADDGNLMTDDNLATVLAPTIIGLKGANAKESLDTEAAIRNRTNNVNIAIQCCKMLIQYAPQFATVPVEFASRLDAEKHDAVRMSRFLL